MEILINFATRSRPAKFEACIDNMLETATGKMQFAIKVDSDDTCLPAYIGFGCALKIGLSNNKVYAINRDIPEDWDILLNHSDDMIFIQNGWDEIIKADMLKYFPDLDGVLHYPDGHANGLMTYSIIGRKYYERFGYVYHPDYTSLWCDNEAQEVAQQLGKYQFINNQLFEHKHYAWGLTEKDELYQLNDTYHFDQAVYLNRKQRNFDL